MLGQLLQVLNFFVIREYVRDVITQQSVSQSISQPMGQQVSTPPFSFPLLLIPTLAWTLATFSVGFAQSS